VRRLHVGFDELGRDQLHVMAMLANTPGPIMGTPTGFQPDAERWYIRHKGEQSAPSEALAEHHSTCAIHANDVKHQFCNVDSQYGVPGAIAGKFTLSGSTEKTRLMITWIFVSKNNAVEAYCCT